MGIRSFFELLFVIEYCTFLQNFEPIKCRDCDPYICFQMYIFKNVLKGPRVDIILILAVLLHILVFICIHHTLLKPL